MSFWTPIEVDALVAIWAESMRILVADGLPLVPKYKALEAKMKAQGFDRTAIQIKSKLNHLTKKFKETLRKNKTSGSSPAKCPHYDTFVQIYGERASISPQDIYDTSDVNDFEFLDRSTDAPEEDGSNGEGIILLQYASGTSDLSNDSSLPSTSVLEPQQTHFAGKQAKEKKRLRREKLSAFSILREINEARKKREEEDRLWRDEMRRHRQEVLSLQHDLLEVRRQEALDGRNLQLVLQDLIKKLN